MARIGGRNRWIAVPVGLLCAAVVGALVWLALPGIPAVVEWTGDTLRRGTAAEAREAEPTPAQLATDGRLDCRELYPSDLWSRMLLARDAQLKQDLSAPATAATGLVDALTPEVRVSCRWTGDSGTVATTLAFVETDAAALADPALRGQGFDCSSVDDTLTCVRTEAGVLEEHVVRGHLWLATTESTWHPEDYTERLRTYVWG
ncbi:hypothetical protein JOD63_002294 [Microbacterium terrae]|uniref:Uncharacterized protein n=1 Tax=Microbacterium terrae TaxID=69369 RepID=A0A0M2H4K0_9MICO|nr:hypothetical protein [Microbacterium terrae]KJL39386.1 hypothetical protein RS81_02016 [Microbacterium terrae]MBP1078326.1 hypothetical protein [Microbacterium terrae]GLJ97805.1 hypothetical protein GCM10017594_10020 [Microbacterium terrae]